MMHMTFDDLPEELNVKSPLALVTANGDTPQDEIIRLQVVVLVVGLLDEVTELAVWQVFRELTA